VQRGPVCLAESERVRFFLLLGNWGEWAREAALVFGEVEMGALVL
jgi:hypothetical protein